MWTFVLTDRRGVAYGELRQISARKLSLPLNRVPTLAFTMRASHPLAPYVMLTDQTLVKGYENSTGRNVLRFCGPIIGADKVRDNGPGSIAVTAAGPLWRLSRRLIGRSGTGATFGTTALSLLARGEIMARMVDALNAGDATNIFTREGDTGIRRGSIASTPANYVGPWYYKRADEAVAELYSPLDGFDFEVAPVEPVGSPVGTQAGAVQIGALNIAPTIGAVNLEAVWEYGTGRRNVATWRDTLDAGKVCNDALSLPAGFPDNASQAVLEQADTASIAARGLYEDIIGSDLVVDAMRTKLLQAHVAVRATPQRLIVFDPVAEDTPSGGEPRRVPRLFDDFIVGDVMPFRAVEQYDVLAADGTIAGQVPDKSVDALFRAHRADLDIGDDGVVKTTLSFLEE